VSEALVFYKVRDPKSSKKQRGGSVFNRILLLIVALLGLILVGQLVFHFILAPRLTVRNITIKSDLSLSKDEVLSVAGIEENLYYFSLDSEEIRKSLESLPMIREAAVRKVFPDSLSITLYGREALSMLLFTTPEGQSVPLVVDDQGVIFEIGSAVSSWDLPVLTGVKFKQLRVGMKLPEAVRPVLRDLRSLQIRNPDLFRLISEIRLISTASGVTELLLYPLQYPVRLRLPAELDPAALRTALVVLDLMAEQELANEVKELDFRTGEVVYRIEED
jgi:cell division protein FtsQ